MDVAIGAPGEQENLGAVYLFHGTSELDISLSHSQVRPHRCPYYDSSFSADLLLSNSGFSQLPD